MPATRAVPVAATAPILILDLYCRRCTVGVCCDRLALHNSMADSTMISTPIKQGHLKFLACLGVLLIAAPLPESSEHDAIAIV